MLDTALNSSSSSQGEHCIPKSDDRAKVASGLRKGSTLPLRTLNQARPNVEDFADLTGRVSRSVRFALAPEEPGLEMPYFKSGGRTIQFPPESQGFFYWHLDPDAPPVSGQLRFRTTRSSDPARFPTGRDLQLPDGRTWNIPLFRIARGSKYSGLRAHLLSEKLVTADVLHTALKISSRRGERIEHPATSSLLIWKFGQRFLVDLPSTQVTLWIIGSSAGERLVLPSLSSVCVRESRESESTWICYVLGEPSGLHISPHSAKNDFAGGADYIPFKVRALVQFERSTLPEHKGTRTVVLRIVNSWQNQTALMTRPGCRKCRTMAWI
ncbi:hypothetical protein OE88DRAFT_1707836 [Heliocybe sulcata]|uniref:Uncharacterized protein n=1 Tax=Heliocybe sulcata TaxID=5364 RepID=A0A5C3MQ99_9AGAM|nr:hypothetical protein OE88DRAFT_1707836 [Heliocybe sulcata]